ncbi:MAG TPA: class I SAM-dependent methyltransferase [Streptosporangiaceae bacterium]|nr:class I SAM-dependent methyltransferase [Streptosporangiaceae bacterium]
MCADHELRSDTERLRTFEEIYVQAGQDFSVIPWAALAPNPALVAWLDQRPPPSCDRALIIGCGLGDDAEEAARRGYRVTAFDLSPMAIRHCHERFPRSAVDYHVADLFHLPARWNEAFSLVVEIRTLQSLPLPQRAAAAAAIAATVRPGGQVFVRCLARDDGEPPVSRPWPVSRGELRGFIKAGLREAEFADQPAAEAHGRFFTAVYARPGGPEFPERREST